MLARIKVVTPGTYLSTRTTWSIIGDLAECVARGLIRTLAETEPGYSKRKIAEKVRPSVNLYFERVERGSWEITFLAALAGILGKVAYDLGIEMLKENPTFERVKAWMNGREAPVSKAVAEELQKPKQLGPLVVESRTVDVFSTADFTRIVESEIRLKMPQGAEFVEDVPAGRSVDEQVRSLMVKLRSHEERAMRKH